MSKRGQTSGNELQDQHAKDELAWFDEKLDEKVIHLLTKYCGFESKLKLGCIRSWQRLVDEFTGMLAFAPMPCVHQAKKSHVQGQVGSGRAGTLNFNEETVKLVVELGGREGLVRPQLKQLQRRLQRLVQRDYASAVHTLEAHCGAELDEFLSLVNSNAEDEQASDPEFVDVGPTARRQEPTTTAMILSCVKEALLEHAKSEISLELEGSAEKDDSGAPIWDDVIKKYQKRLKSGMMVREGENTLKPAALHWMLPFKFNNGGQMSLRKLRFENSDKDSAWGIWPFARSSPTFPNAVDRHQVGWHKELLEEIKDCERSEEKKIAEGGGTPYINCSNAVNLQIFRMCTEDYEVPVSRNGEPKLYDCEVLKLLKALQFEMASAWHSMWKGMLQELTDPEKVTGFVKAAHKAMEKPVADYVGAAGMCLLSTNNKQVQSSPSDDAAWKAVVEVVCHDLRVSYAEDLTKTTQEEISSLGEEAKWPDYEGYMKVLDRAAETSKENSNDFLGRRKESLAGQASWSRLCQELVFVILQLDMDRVSEEELSMSKSSAGVMSAAGQQEMIAKLAQHRLFQLNKKNKQVFMHRFDSLWTRDVDAVMGQNARVKESLQYDVGSDKKAEDWLIEQLHMYKDRVVGQTMAALEEEFKSLFPADFTLLNGRFNLNEQKLRKQTFVLTEDGRSVRETDATQDIHRMWESDRYGLTQTVVVCPGKPAGSETIQLSVDATIAAYANFQERTHRVEQIFALPSDHAPKAGFAGGAFQELCLNYFKQIHVHAIHYYRPKLKALLARLYQERHLRQALQRSPAMAKVKEKTGQILKRETKRKDRLRRELNSMRETLRTTDPNRNHGRR
ncbi:unnamed protein product [Symbiodinium necroappetens]|uniref:Uncharacterized protein n=1 Tax=Symbiodinium necroappetens TaxID=1628268 RepID=A0A813C814_9DINO|nr:unnamed protein product [Symbiodinium necroappetens]